MSDIDLSDRLNRRALMLAFAQERPFCVWMDETGETFLSAKEDMPEGVHVCFIAEAIIRPAAS